MFNNEITKIVITGGPCAGKTTALKHIKECCSQMGYHILFIAETATELISGGVSPWILESDYEYQLCQMKLQLAKESVFEEAAQKIPGCNKILIICDRGIMDNSAYMTREDFERAKAVLSLKENIIHESYGAIFHLVSAAKGAEEHYTLANNPARTETPEEAAAMDDKLIDAWAKHPYHRIIDNSGTFENKMNRLVEEIKRFLLKE